MNCLLEYLMCLPFSHQWKLRDSQEITRISNLTNKVTKIWHVHTLVCKKCGWIKTKKFSLSD